MTDHRHRFREFMAAEAAVFAAAAQRARTLDHKGTRGGDFERVLQRWLRERLEPEFTASSGEVVDSFNTNATSDSRQHDVIVHQNTRFARRFTFENGVRLVPVEAVAALVEVKLDVDRTSFFEADAAALQTRALRLAVDERAYAAGAGTGRVEETRRAGPIDGKPASEFGLRMLPVLFAFNGPSQLATYADWLANAKAFQAICCLSAGCVTRFHPSVVSAASQTDALVAFLAVVEIAIHNFDRSSESWAPLYGKYNAFQFETLRSDFDED